MKTFAAAAALILSGSAMAWAPQTDPAMDVTGAKMQTSAEASAVMAKKAEYATILAKNETLPASEAMALDDTKAAGVAVGGPIDSRTDYPACTSRMQDSCIQLYERGVTGAGN